MARMSCKLTTSLTLLDGQGDLMLLYERMACVGYFGVMDKDWYGAVGYEGVKDRSVVVQMGDVLDRRPTSCTAHVAQLYFTRPS